MERIKNTVSGYLNHHKTPLILGIFSVIAVIATALFLFFIIQEINLLKNNTTIANQELTQRLNSFEAALATSTLTGQELADRIQEQQNISSSVQESLDDISGTVGNLEKLSKTDKELLQKYSRVYFLSDNYVPMSLENISEQYLNDTAKILQFHSSALPFLERMMSKAERSNISLKVVSAYRSFGTQSSLKNAYLTTYGSGSNQFSADQGYSEHQLGTAVDITVQDFTPALTVGFDQTPAFKWLASNAYKYGFVLSYNKGNAYYQYEPWHWRFVGVDLATRLHNDDLNFSDMDQRDIDKYLVNIFD